MPYLPLLLAHAIVKLFLNTQPHSAFACFQEIFILAMKLNYFMLTEARSLLDARDTRQTFSARSTASREATIIYYIRRGLSLAVYDAPDGRRAVSLMGKHTLPPRHFFIQRRRRLRLALGR